MPDLRLWTALLLITTLNLYPVSGVEITTLTASYTSSTITVDGILDEEDWGKSDVTGNFIQLEPAEGIPSVRRTEVRVLFGKDNLYIGAVMYGTPDETEATLGRRDEYNRADWFMVSIDSYYNRRTAYTFAVNAAGVQLDGQQGGMRTFGTGLFDGLDLSWDAIWFSSVRIKDSAWIAELRIPYSMLRFPDTEDQSWGIHFMRRIPLLGEISEWPHIPRSERTNLVARYGTISGISGIEPRRNIQFRPYMLTGIDIYEDIDRPGSGVYDTRLDIGGDIKVGLGTNIMLDATVNPDFGQVEADPAVLNLTAFETFFTEKRPFFIEGADIFQFGIGMSRLFYTRRIGAREPIIGAAKISGRSAGGLSFGLLGTAAGHSFRPSHNYGVLRASQQIGSYSSAGGIITAYRSPPEKGIGWQSMTGGVDWDLRLAGNRYSLEGIAAFADRQPLIPGTDAETGFMSGLTFRKREGTVDYHVTLLAFSDQYNPNDLGWTSFEQNFYEAWSGLNYRIRGGQPFGPFQRANIRVFNRQRYSYLEWWNMGDYMQVRSEWMTRGFRMIRANAAFSEILGGYDIWETRGLGRWARPYHIQLTGEYNSDERKNRKISPSGRYRFYGDGGQELGLGITGIWDIGTRFSFSAFIEGEWERSVTAWASNESFIRQNGEWYTGVISAPPDMLDPDHLIFLGEGSGLEQIFERAVAVAPGQYYLPVFGERDTRSLDLTVRGSLTFTADISVQLYTQMFVAGGRYNNFSILTAPDDLVRFDPFPKRNEFLYNNLQSNLVFRWEYRPGSTVYLVWSHGRRKRDEMNPLAPWGPSYYDKNPGRQLGEVFEIFPHNTVMVKINYAIF